MYDAFVQGLNFGQNNMARMAAEGAGKFVQCRGKGFGPAIRQWFGKYVSDFAGIIGPFHNGGNELAMANGNNGQAASHPGHII
jgi:hypothetical protein